MVIGGFAVPGNTMGMANLFNTIMNTSHDLLLNTVFFIMTISVITGALSSLVAGIAAHYLFLLFSLI